MSAYNVANFMQITEDSLHLEIWTASFVDIHRFVPPARTLVVDRKYAANLPGMAAEFLGSRYLWWAILMYNGLADAINDVRPGVKLLIPDKDALVSYLQSRTSDRDSSNYLATLQPTLL